MTIPLQRRKRSAWSVLGFHKLSNWSSDDHTSKGGEEEFNTSGNWATVKSLKRGRRVVYLSQDVWPVASQPSAHYCSTRNSLAHLIGLCENGFSDLGRQRVGYRAFARAADCKNKIRAVLPVLDTMPRVITPFLSYIPLYCVCLTCMALPHLTAQSSARSDKAPRRARHM